MPLLLVHAIRDYNEVLLMITAIGDPEDAQIVLENCLDKDVVYRFLRPWLGHGLFVAPGKYDTVIKRVSF